jgi:hypothetical protein
MRHAHSNHMKQGRSKGCQQVPECWHQCYCQLQKEVPVDTFRAHNE